eukprot:850528-Alexandrium_andersonii.AAC.1
MFVHLPLNSSQLNSIHLGSQAPDKRKPTTSELGIWERTVQTHGAQYASNFRQKLVFCSRKYRHPELCAQATPEMQNGFRCSKPEMET